MKRLGMGAATATLAAGLAVWTMAGLGAQGVDLNGRWQTSDGVDIDIEQTGQHVKGTFLSGGDCAGGEKRDAYFEGTLVGARLTGTMKRCTRDRQLLRTCHLVDPYTASIEATVDAMAIAGTYVADFVTYDCRVTPAGGSHTPFSLTRSGPAPAGKPAVGPSPGASAGDIKARPIIAMTLASSIGDTGDLVNPKFTFSQTDPQVTAVVDVGKTTTGLLTVTWFKVVQDEDGTSYDDKLFEHRIQVKSAGRAYSVAKNPGVAFERGTYRVVASLEKQSQAAKFRIAAPRGLATPGRSLNQSDGPQQGGRPIAGSGGTSPLPSGPSPDFGGDDCKVFVRSGFYDRVWPGGPVVPVLASARCSSSFIERVRDNPVYEVNANIESAPFRRLGSITATASEPGPSVFDLNPCDLPAGSDLPGTRIRLRAATSDGLVKSQTFSENYGMLGDDTWAPGVLLLPNTAAGSMVKEGDKIVLAVTAAEDPEGDGWQTGVKRIWLEPTPDGASALDEWNNPSRLPKPCRQKTWQQDIRTTYVVPRRPPPVIEICAYAEDYAEKQGEDCAVFFSGEWNGTLTETAEGNLYAEKLTVTFAFDEQRDGTLNGSARAKLTSAPQQFNGCDSTRKLITPQPLLFPITGKHVGNEFQLQLPTNYRLNLRVILKCPPPQQSGVSTATRSLGMSQALYRPRVRAEDGATNSFDRPGALKVSGTIEIHRTKR